MYVFARDISPMNTKSALRLRVIRAYDIPEKRSSSILKSKEIAFHDQEGTFLHAHIPKEIVEKFKDVFREFSCPKNSTETEVVQDPLQEANRTDNMHVEETHPSPPIAKHGAWMIVNRKTKGPAKRPEKARGKPTGEVKAKSTRTPNDHKVTQGDGRTGGASGAVRAAGNSAQQVHTVTNLSGKGNQIDVIPVSNTFSYLQDLESLPEAPVLLEEETAPRSAPKAKNQRRNNKGKKQPTPAPESTLGRAGLRSEGGPAPNQLFVFGNPNRTNMNIDGFTGGNEASSSKSLTQSNATGLESRCSKSMASGIPTSRRDPDHGITDVIYEGPKLNHAQKMSLSRPAILPREEVNKIRSIPIPLDDLVPDALYWPTSPGGMFSVREAYRYIVGGDSSDDVDWVWKVKTAERCRMFL
nr:replication protein A 70 kDa DNA-binding subunit D-like [Ipomoea batatas]